MEGTKRIEKSAKIYFFLALAEFGIWYILRFWVKPEWLKSHVDFWICFCFVIFVFFVWHITSCLVLLRDSPISWWIRRSQEKREFRKKLEEIDREFNEVFRTPKT